jgi:hypothetical protein
MSYSDTDVSHCGEYRRDVRSTHTDDSRLGNNRRHIHGHVVVVEEGAYGRKRRH